MSSEITIRTTKSTLLSWEAILALKVDLLLPEVTPVLTIPRLWEVTPTRWTQQSTLSCGDSSSVKGRPSTQDGSTHSRGDSSFIGGHPSTQDGHPRGALLLLAATQVLKPNTPQATPLLWEAVQVLKKAMDSQTRPVIPHLESLPTLQDSLPLTPVSIITDRDSRWRL
jgi:hypothetical protein